MGVLNLNSSIIFSIIFLGFPFNFFFILSLIKYELLLLNSHILSGFFPKIVYLPLIFPFSTDSKIKLFFSFRKLSIKFNISLSSLIFFAKKRTWLFFFFVLKLKIFEVSINHYLK
jgi:hypothetical protein